MTTFTVELGAEVISNISGFTGIVCSRSEHINGCNRYWLQPKIDKDGKLPDGLWLDEAELVVVNPPALKQKNTDRGGPYSKVR